MRLDLSKYVFHFIHDRDPANDPDFIYTEGEPCLFPFHADPDKNARFADWYAYDQEYPIDPDGSAIQVLRKILDDGHVRAGWSFRKGKPTIYGPRAACCFTEMPLYALIQYARSRGDNLVTPYGIALLKQELYHAGGRPVIYGLSRNPHITTAGVFRYLSVESDLPEGEQYRFVSLNLDRKPPVDWTHEREWRWADTSDRCSCPGLPILLADEPISFSRVLLFVDTEEEAEDMLSRIKSKIDAGFTIYDSPYAKSTLENTKVVSLESAFQHFASRGASLIRIETLPVVEMRKYRTPEVSEELASQMTVALQDAAVAAATAAAEWREAAPRTEQGDYADVFGQAYLMTYDAQSVYVQALVKIGAIDSWEREGYCLSGLPGKCCVTGILGEAEVAADAARDALQTHFPEWSIFVRLY